MAGRLKVLLHSQRLKAPRLYPLRSVSSAGATSIPRNRQLIPCHLQTEHPSSVSLSAHRQFSRKCHHLGYHLAAASQPLLVRDDCLVLQSQEGGEGLRLPFFWLRDNCRCNQCFHPSTNQLLHNIVDLDLNITAVDVYQNNATEVNITWSDGHRSAYQLDWLRDHAPALGARLRNRTLWKGGTFEMPSFSLRSLRNDVGALRSLLRTVDEFGVALIEGVGSSNTDDLEEIANMVAGLESTFYNAGISVAHPGLKEADTGYTNLPLPLHTDTTYFSQPCRGMLLQVTKRDGLGGSTVLSDGFYAVEQLANRHPEFLEILCREDLVSQYLDGDKKHFQASGPVISVNPRSNQVERLRFNPLDRAPNTHLADSELKSYYQAYQALAREIYDEANRFTILPSPDQAVLYDNWRVLHGRESFTGHRVLKSAYLRNDDWMSNMRVIGQLPV